uniref:LIM domain only protein 7-like n=1 Tax=Sinocyclocheilus rhinocerous TaxID=307959 RepID=A0A673I3E3_9TELE
VTKKKFVSSNFRSSLENGLLLCDLINKIRPGVVKKLNRLSTPIAGLDNISLFLKACAKLGLKEAQLFHPGDLQDLSTRVTVKHQESSRRLKNVLITIYWLGRKAHADHFYNGPYLKLKAFEGLLGKALYKTLEDCTSLQGSVRNSSCRDSWYSEKEELFPLRAGHRREDSLDSLDSLGSRTYSTSSDATLKGSSEGCGSDPEADLSFMMSENKEYRRSLVVAPKTTTQYNQFLPSKDKQSGYVPAPLRKKRAERNDDNRRSWASPMYTEDDGTFTRSKSVSDITDSEMNLSNLSMELRVEEMQKMRARLKDNEDKWQDDLSRWKNKRRSVNSDIVKKKEEREQIDQISSGGIRKSKTFKEMQDERESRQQSNYRDSFNSISDDVFEEPVPRSRTLPARSYTIDTPYAPKDKPSVPSIPYLREKEPHTSVSKTSSVLNSSELISNTKPVKNSSGPISSLYKPNSMDTKQSGLDQVSASLPRSYQRSDSARLTSVVTPRPFGTQSNRITSLPRVFTVDNSLKRTNGETDSLKKSTISNRYAQYVKEDDDISQESPVQSSDEEEEEEKTPSPVPPVNRLSPLPKSPSTLIPSNEVDYSEMRISLNQKPNSSRDFGFQSDWDSTGVRVKSVVPGSPAELGQVKVGDEILTVNGHMVADLSYTEWKNSMEEALQQGSLFMDICRHGKNNWGRDLPSLPFKSHKTINLTSLDPLGPSEPYLSTNLDFTSQQTKDMVVKTVNVSSQSGNRFLCLSGLGEFSRDYKKEPQSQAEVERQQILHEMKKKTSLNTDNSWIRQQSAANVTTKELMDLPIRRGESLDNLDMPRSSWRSSWSTSNSTVSIPDYSRPHSSLSGSSSYQSGRPESANLQSSQSMSSLRQSWSVSGRKICSFCNTPLGKGAAMIIESQGLCYHLSCFKCFKCRSDLGGSEAGAEVRIRNQQLYCNSCYMRLKSGQPTAM